MFFASGTQFHIRGVNAKCLNSVLNVKVVVAAFNQEEAVVECKPSFPAPVARLNRFYELSVFTVD